MVSVLRYAFRTVKRHGDKSVLTVIGLSLAIASMILVYTVGISFQSDLSSVYHHEVAGNSDVWLTPRNGFYIDLASRAIFANGTLSQDLFTQASALIANGTLPQGTKVEGVIVDRIRQGSNEVILYGSTSVPTGAAVLSPGAASLLGIKDKQSFTFRGIGLVASVETSPIPIIVKTNLATAQRILNATGSLSWLTFKSPLPRGVVTFYSRTMGFVPSDDPKVNAVGGDSKVPGIAYLLTGVLLRGEVTTFDTRFSSLLVSQVLGSAFGGLGQVTLFLGFVLTVSSSILTLEERRKEMGILASIGIVTDIIYEFLAEFVIIFAISVVAGLVIGVTLDYYLLPQIFSVEKLVGAIEIISGFIPPMILFGALIPTDIILNKRPVLLMRSA